MIKKVFAVLVLSAFAIPALAEEQDDNETLAIYAYFAKLEANIVEAGKAVSLAVALPNKRRAVRTAIREFESDIEQFNFYVDALEGLDLSGDQEEVLANVVMTFDDLSEKGWEFLEDPHDAGKAFFRWWKDMDELEEEVDQVLEDIAEDNGIPLF